MVYRQPPDEVRHAAWPLRLGGAGTDEVVESHRIACTHFDAFRFFTDAGPAAQHPAAGAATTGRRSSSRAACTPAMDLYKWAYKLTPLVPLGAGGGLLRAGPRHPGARHAGRRRTTCAGWASTRSGSRPPRASRQYVARSATSPARRRRCAQRLRRGRATWLLELGPTAQSSV